MSGGIQDPVKKEQGKKRIAIPNFRRGDFGLFRRIPCDMTLERRGAEEGWLIFKDHLHQAQVHPDVQEVGRRTKTRLSLSKGYGTLKLDIPKLLVPDGVH